MLTDIFYDINICTLHVALSVTWQEKHTEFRKGAGGGGATITLSEGHVYKVHNVWFPDKFCVSPSFFCFFFFCVKDIGYSCPEIEYI